MEVPPDHRHDDRKPPPPLPAPPMLDNHRDAAVEVSELPPSRIGGLTKAPVKTAGDSDETDYSTSFAETASTNDNNSSAVSDAEVESQFYSDVNGLSSPFDDFGSVFRMRKKKLTSHWRNFIHPLMWRCKWAELKMKQFELQALKYAKIIAAHNRTKQLAQKQSVAEGFSSRSMPYTFQRRRRKLMKRRKRVRVEDKIDANLYMSQHILFSYHEIKLDPDGISMTNDDPVFTEQGTTSQEELGLGTHNSWSFHEDKDNDMEQILQKIEIAHSRVHKLKAQLDSVISNNAGVFPSSDNLSHVVPFEAHTSSVRSPNFSTCNGEAMSAGGLYASTQRISELDMGDLAMNEHAVSSYGEGFHIPDIIESTMGILSSVDVTQHQSQIGDSCEKIVDNMLVDDQTAEPERPTFRNCQHPPSAVKQEEDETTESDYATKDPAVQEPSRPKPDLVSEFQMPKNKRKRGERKASTGNWSRQRPGEPDSP